MASEPPWPLLNRDFDVGYIIWDDGEVGFIRQRYESEFERAQEHEADIPRHEPRHVPLDQELVPDWNETIRPLQRAGYTHLQRAVYMACLAGQCSAQLWRDEDHDCWRVRYFWRKTRRVYDEVQEEKARRVQMTRIVYPGALE